MDAYTNTMCKSAHDHCPNTNTGGLRPHTNPRRYGGFRNAWTRTQSDQQAPSREWQSHKTTDNSAPLRALYWQSDEHQMLAQPRPDDRRTVHELGGVGWGGGAANHKAETYHAHVHVAIKNAFVGSLD